MPLVACRRFKIAVVECTQAQHYLVKVEVIEYIGTEEFKKAAKLFRKLYMKLESKRPWTWARAFSSRGDAQDFAGELCRLLHEPAYMDEDLRLRLVSPTSGLEGVE
jgi:hypothetical protein